jgi:hypothetical protein
MTHIRVYHTDDRRMRSGGAFDHCGAETKFARAMNDPNPVRGRERFGDLARSVRRIVVDDDQLGVEAFAAIRIKDGVHQLRQSVALVVGRNDETERRGQRRRLNHTQSILWA